MIKLIIYCNNTLERRFYNQDGDFGISKAVLNWVGYQK